MRITIDDKKRLTSVYNKPTYSHLYEDGTLCHPTKNIDVISIGVAKRLKLICSNDGDFLEQSKKYSAYLAACNHKPKQIIRAFENINNQPRSTVQQKKSKKLIKQYKPLVLTSTLLLKSIFLSLRTTPIHLRCIQRIQSFVHIKGFSILRI